MGFIGDLKRDFARHDRHLTEPGVWTLANYRFGRLIDRLPGPLAKVGDAVYRVTSLAIELACGSIVPREVEFGDSPHLIHALNLRIAPGVKFGNRCGMMHEVTIAPAHGKEGVPTFGDDVFIGVGATIRGPIRIGHRAIIGAKSLVTEDVPDGVFVVGVPAKRMGWPTTHVDDRGKSKV